MICSYLYVMKKQQLRYLFKHWANDDSWTIRSFSNFFRRILLRYVNYNGNNAIRYIFVCWALRELWKMRKKGVGNMYLFECTSFLFIKSIVSKERAFVFAVLVTCYEKTKQYIVMKSAMTMYNIYYNKRRIEGSTTF